MNSWFFEKYGPEIAKYCFIALILCPPSLMAQSQGNSEPPINRDSSLSTDYVITGIAFWDTLNVRQGPGATTPIVAKLKDGTSPIRIIGEAVWNGTDDWIPVAFPGGKGWLRPKYLRQENGPAAIAEIPVSAEVARMLSDCRNDQTRFNATHAMNYFFDYPSTHKQLWQMYDSMDQQGKDIILAVLTGKSDAQPVDKLLKIVFDRAELGAASATEFFHPRSAASRLLKLNIRRVQSYVPGYITSDDFEDQFSALGAIVENDLWESYQYLYTPDVIRKMARNFRNDQKIGNAIDAVEFFKLLGGRGIEILEEVSQWTDAQARGIARDVLLFAQNQITERELDVRLTPIIHK